MATARAHPAKLGMSEYGSFHVDREDGYRVLDCFGRRHTLLLPACRQDRVRLDVTPLSEYAAPPDDTESQKQKRVLQYLRGLDVFPGALAVLGAYVSRVIPDPLRSQGLWSLMIHEADVCIRVNVGNTEVLTVTAGGGVRIFVSGEGIFEQEIHSLLHKDYREHKERFWVVQPPFVIGRHVPLRLIGCENLKVGDELLSREFVLDGAYWLVRELMLRQGPTWAKRHHRALALEVLEAARRDISKE